MEPSPVLLALPVTDALQVANVLMVFDNSRRITYPCKLVEIPSFTRRLQLELTERADVFELDIRDYVALK